MDDIPVPFVEVHYVTIQKLGDVPIVKGDLQGLPPKVRSWVAQMVRKALERILSSIFSLALEVQLCTPRGVYICDGSDAEAEMVTEKLIERGTLTKLTKYENCHICWTDPRVRRRSSLWQFLH